MLPTPLFHVAVALPVNEAISGALVLWAACEVASFALARAMARNSLNCVSANSEMYHRVVSLCR